MLEKHFVAISGISNMQQLEGIKTICNKEKINFPICIGYQVSNKSINQDVANPRQPLFADLRELSQRTEAYDFIPAFHYYTKDPLTVVGDLEKITKKVDFLNRPTIQFNTLPPDAEILLKAQKMGFRIILKVAVSDKSSGGYAVWKGDGVQDVSSGEVAPLVGQILERKDFADYVMFDPSQGTNLELDLSEDSLAIRFGKEVRSRPELKHCGLVYAGGISVSNVGEVARTLHSFFPNRSKALYSTFPNGFSIDIESGVRTDNELDLSLVRKYLIGYAEAME